MHHKQDENLLINSVRCLLLLFLILLPFNTSGCLVFAAHPTSVLSSLTRAENLELPINILKYCRQVVQYWRGSSSSSCNRQETHNEICLPRGQKEFFWVLQHRLNTLSAAFFKIGGYICVCKLPHLTVSYITSCLQSVILCSLIS